jgi:hypothetical protein
VARFGVAAAIMRQVGIACYKRFADLRKSYSAGIEPMDDGLAQAGTLKNDAGGTQIVRTNSGFIPARRQGVPDLVGAGSDHSPLRGGWAASGMNEYEIPSRLRYLRPCSPKSSQLGC